MNWPPNRINPRLSVHVLLRTCTSHPLEHSTHFDIQEEQSLSTYIHTPKQTQSQQSKYNRRINQPRHRAEKTRQAPHTHTDTDRNNHNDLLTKTERARPSLPQASVFRSNDALVMRLMTAMRGTSATAFPGP